MTSTKNPVHPVGDCPCGKVDKKADSSGDQTELSRSWIAKIMMTKDSGEEMFCSGSILNR